MNESQLISSKIWIYLKFVLVVYAFYSLICWPFFSINRNLLSYAFSALVLPAFINPNLLALNQKRGGIVVLFLVMMVWTAGLGNINLYVHKIITSLPLVVLLLLKEDCILDLLKSFEMVFFVIVALGTVFWILHLFGIDLPYQDVTFGEKEQANGMIGAQYYFQNHYLYLVNTRWMMNDYSTIPTFFRFCSIFLEPGYFAILLMFLLYLNKFNMKDYRNWVYLIALLLTLSLAGFIMTLLAFVAHKLETSKRKISILISISLFLFVGYFFFPRYNGGNNAINELIIERLKVDEEKGIAGNNRTSAELDDQYKALLSSADVLFGVRKSDLLEYGVGYKAYIVKDGLIGLALFIIFLLKIARIGGNYRSFVLMALYLLMFARGHGTMFYLAFILVYMAGIIESKQEKLSLT